MMRLRKSLKGSVLQVLRWDFGHSVGEVIARVLLQAGSSAWGRGFAMDSPRAEL